MEIYTTYSLYTYGGHKSCSTRERKEKRNDTIKIGSENVEGRYHMGNRGIFFFLLSHIGSRKILSLRERKEPITRFSQMYSF
jgi:hypothetical protein